MDKSADERRNVSVEVGEVRSSGSGVALHNLRTFKSFRIPVYRTYYGAMAGQWAVQSMLMMTNALLVYRLTGSGTIIGVVTLAQGLPQTLIALFGGIVADRTQKKHILLFSQIFLAFIGLAFAVAFSMGYVSSERWWLLLVLAAFEGSLLGFLQPASFSIIPEIVGGEQVMNAISLSSMGHTVFRLIGPSVAGFLIDAKGFPIIYYMMSGLYILGSVFAHLLPNTSPTF